MGNDDIMTEGRASARPIISKEDVQKHVPPARNRTHPVHLSPGEKHNRPIIIYVTTCTAKRRKILASPRTHAAIVNAWRDASTWVVGRYVVMPDHIHFFCAPGGVEVPSLERWMQYWKSGVTKDIDAKKGEVWQRLIGTANLDPQTVTRANGTTSGEIRCVMVCAKIRMIGPIRAN